VENEITEKIIGAELEAHRQLRPGLPESVYEERLCYGLRRQGLRFQHQLEVPVIYKGLKLDCGYRADLLLEDAILVEIKSVESLAPVLAARLLTYLKICQKRVGLLINFIVPVLRNGRKRAANNYEEPLRLRASASNSSPRLTEIPQETV
jgi:GxxExxY protein